MNRDKKNTEFSQSLQEELYILKKTGNYRRLRSSEVMCPEAVNLSSNDYLGLATLHKHLSADQKHAFGSTSSRLLTGNHGAYTVLEQSLSCEYSALRRTETEALIFNSGYHANTGIIPAITGKEDLILSDKLNHASIIDGSALSRATTIRFPHLDYNKLRDILEKKRSNYRRVVIITESVFSMDGDCADLQTLVTLKKEFDCLLYIDEAHSCGVFGLRGLGLCESEGFASEVDIFLGTFGKAYASLGAYAIVEPVLKDYLINRCRSLIFTTALPPSVVEWSHKAFMKSLDMRTERTHLNKLATDLRKELKNRNIGTGGESQIVPVYTGDSEKAVILARNMREQGYIVFPIRPPTVPPGSARIRISLNAAHTWEDIAGIPETVLKSGVLS